MLPRLYAIIDPACFRDDAALFAFAAELKLGGVRLVQYRNKQGSSRQMLSHARELKRIFTSAESLPRSTSAAKETGHEVILIMNDRADLCLAAGFDGVHVGQEDLSPEAARAIIGPARWLGISTHTPEQVREADRTDASYIAIGTVFDTRSKTNPDPVIGLEGVKQARSLTRKPLVAIGGVTRANFREVLRAGADSVAIISDLLAEPRRAAEELGKG